MGEEKDLRCEASSPGEESAAPQDASARVDFGEFPPTSYEEWREAAIAALKGAPFEKSMFTQTYEGITLEPLYTMEHVEDIVSAKAFPGECDMLRGVTASGYVSHPWKIAQPCDFHTPAEGNKLIRHELEKGTTSITLCIDEAAQCGSGSKDSAINGGGLPIETLGDVKTLFEDADLKKYELNVCAGASSALLVAYISEAAKQLGFPLSDLHGCIGSDPIGSYLELGTLPCELDQIFDETAHAIYHAKRHSPKLRTVFLRGDVYHNGGANAVQEVAYVMASAIEMIHAMQVRHLDAEDFAHHVRFSFSLGSNFFMEIAKIRAARVVWAKIMDAFGGSESAKKANIFGRTSFFTKTVYDPYANMLRNSSEAFSAVVGGVEGLTVGCFDEAVRPGDEFSRRVARNAQIMLQEEYGLLQPVDPAGGSWYLESLTDTLAGKVWEAIQEIQASGGMIACVKEGHVQSSINDVLKQRFKKLASRSDRAVGTNMYPNTTEQPLSANAAGCACERGERIQTLKTFCENRDREKLRLALDDIDGKSLEGGELIRLIAEAGNAGAALEEIRRTLDGDTPGEPEITPIHAHRWTEQYEEMRHRTETYRDRTGDNVRIFLANMGPIPQHKARADFITGFMEVGNFQVLKNDGYPTVETCAQAAAESGGDIAVICSTDATYPELVPPLAKRIREKKPSMKVFLAGAPAEEFKQSYLDAGVDEFISVRSNCLEVLTSLQKAKGMFS